MKILKLNASLLLVIALLPLLAGCSAKAKLERHVRRGDEYFEKQEFAKAKIEYLNAVRRGSRDAGLHSRLAECFMKEGEIGPAYQALAVARNIEPSNNIVRTKMAGILAAVGQTDKAKEEVQQVLKASPADPEALVLSAEASTTKEETEAIKKQIEAARESYPTNSALSFALGIAARKLQDTKTAEAEFEKAIALNPAKSSYHLALAEVVSAQGDTNRAETVYKKAVSLAEVKSWERIRYAEFLFKNRRIDEGIAFLEETVAKDSSFHRAFNLLTDAYIAQKER